MSDEAHSLVEVFSSSDSGEIAVVKSLLDAAGIPAFSAGEALQDIIGAGRIGGLNTITGPIHISVPDDRAEEARELLSGLSEDD